MINGAKMITTYTYRCGKTSDRRFAVQFFSLQNANQRKLWLGTQVGTLQYTRNWKVERKQQLGKFYAWNKLSKIMKVGL